MTRASALRIAAVALFAASASFAAEYSFTWSLPKPQGNPLEAVAFEADNLHGYALGQLGTVLATEDGGLSWSVRGDIDAFTPDLNDLLLLGPGVLLAAGSSPGLFRSEDGGASWSSIANPSSAELFDLERIDASTLSVMGAAGQVMRSTDNGLSWTLRPSPKNVELSAQLWLDASNGYALGSTCCRRTTNGGSSWSTLPGISETDQFNEGYAIDSQRIDLLADFHTVRTTNGGATWNSTMVPNELVYQATTVVLSPEHRFVASHLEGALVLETTDDGATWEIALDDRSTSGIGDMVRLSDGVLHAVTSDGDLWRSTDDGATWNNFTTSPDDEERVTISTFARTPAGKCFAGSTQPGQAVRRFHTSTDGGDSWFKTPEPAIYFQNALLFTPGGLLLAGGDGGSGHSRVWRSSDEGANWTSHVLPNNFSNGVQVFDLAAPSANESFAAGWGNTGSAVFWSSDAGLTWSQRTAGIPTNQFVTSLSFLDDQVGFAGGGGSNLPRVWKTTNAGAQWTPLGVSGMTDYVFDIHFFDPQNGLASNYSQAQGIYRTTNGGTSWTRVSAAPARYFSFWGNQRGYCTTLNFFNQPVSVLTTTDGGASWSSIPVPSVYGGDRVFALEDGFLVGGTDSMIMHARLTGTTAVDPPSGLGLARLSVESNASARPRVRFSLPQDGPASLAIFDAGGRRVVMLAADDYRGGEEALVSWDGRDATGRAMPSGVYFARLSSRREALAVHVVLKR